MDVKLSKSIGKLWCSYKTTGVLSEKYVLTSFLKHPVT